MIIRKKSKEELQTQAKGFLEYIEKNGEISEKTEKEISKILGLNEAEKRGFLKWLSKEFGKKIDISDKGEIKKSLNKKHFYFGKKWREYVNYLKLKSKEEHKSKIREEVGVFFEQYKTPFDDVNEEIINLITENYSKEILEKAKIFMSSGIYREAYQNGKINNEEFLWYFIKRTNKDDLLYLVNNLSLEEMRTICLKENRWFSISHSKVEVIKILKDEFGGNILIDILTDWSVCDTPFGIAYDRRLDSIKNNISILKTKGYDLKKIDNVRKLLLIDNLYFFVDLVDDVLEFLRNHNVADDVLCKDLSGESKEYLFSKIIKFSESDIEKILGIKPKLDYENNYGYSSKVVNMFGGNGSNKSLTEGEIKHFIWCSSTEEINILSIIWKSKWTKNWIKNIDLIYNEGLISSKDILDYNEYMQSSDDNNLYITSLKIIDNNLLKCLIERGVTKNDFDKFAHMLVSFGQYNFKNFEMLLRNYTDITIKELNSLESILMVNTRNLEIILEKYPNIQKEELNNLHYMLLCANPGNIEIILQEYPNIQTEELFSLTDVLELAYSDNLKDIFKCFGPIDFNVLYEYKQLYSFHERLLLNVDFKENNHNGYVEYINEILRTGYSNVKKKEMVMKISSLSFGEVRNFLKIFQMFDDSISMDVQRVKNELIDEILKSENPERVADAINNIFEKNNLPLTGKIFKVFELLYPQSVFKKTLKSHGSPILHQYLNEGKNVYTLIYKDLMNIAIKSGEHSLKNYINTFVSSKELLRKFETVVSGPGFDENNKFCLEGKLEEKEQEQLLYLFRRCSVLYDRYYGKEVNEPDSIEDNVLGALTISDDKLVKFYNKIKKGFHLKNGESIYDRLQRFLYGLGYNSFEEVLDKMDETKRLAHKQGLELYNESNSGKISFPKHAFLKGVDEGAFSQIINRGITCREYLGGGENGNAAGSDGTPFDTDGWYTDLFLENGYGNVNLVVDTEKDNIYNSSEKGVDGYTNEKYELFKTGYLGENHYGIRTGIPTTEINYVIYTGSFEGKEFQDMCYEIARNGYYIPITDRDGNIKFTPEMYHKIRLGFNYMKYYDGFDVELRDGKYVLKESDDKVRRDVTDMEVIQLIEDNSPENEKYKDFAMENKELAENTIKWIKRILKEKCGIKFNSKYDSSITGAELHDSGSTGRGTDIPTKDVDLDFTLILDSKDYERVAEISKVIHEEIGTQKDDDHGVVEGGNQIKSKINNIGKSGKRPNGVPLDLLILKKSQVIDYSSSDAMKEKLNYIASNLQTGAKDLDWVRTNVIIMKKLLKAKECYKKPEGGIGGIGVENWIIQNHGNFIEALESFEQVAYGGEYEEGKQPIHLSEFQKLYPIYDAGENYKDGGNDNFVYKLKESGYKGTLEIVKTYRLEGIKGIRKLIEEYEIKKSEFIE